MKFSGGVVHSPITKCLHFGSNLGNDTDPGIF